MEVFSMHTDRARSPTAEEKGFQENAIQAFIPLVSWRDTYVQDWNSPHVEASIGEGSGQYASPFSMTSHDFLSKCQDFGFSQEILRKLGDHASLFEHVFQFSQDGLVPSYLEVFMSAYENDAYFCLFRYNIQEKEAKAVFFVKTGDYSERRLIQASEIQAWFEQQSSRLDRHPLLVLNALFGAIQSRTHDYIDWRIRLNNMESQLGVTEYAEALREGRYENISHDFELLNADLARLSKRAADNALSASTIYEHAKALQRLVGICEAYELKRPYPPETLFLSEQYEEVQSTITRAELYLKFMKMVDAVLQSQTAILYNRINRQESQSMKTIAVVTLVFIPAAFVSTVFASGIFNFHASEPAGAPQAISKYGWVFLLICVLATVFTLALWLLWYIWGRKVLEASRLSRLGRREKIP